MAEEEEETTYYARPPSTTEEETIEEVFEPYLMQIGFLARTPKGRIVTRLAFDHLGIKQERSLNI